jgi:NADH dehydrogenase [ubiquinone] 1 alpha subcomplex assembly factor 5
MNQPNPFLVFDPTLVRRHRHRAAANFDEHNILNKETVAHLIERLEDIKHDFKTVLCYGPCGSELIQYLERRGSSLVICADMSELILGRTISQGKNIVFSQEILPFNNNSFDLIISNLSLHWINDLPGAMLQIKDALRPDGLFIATLLGGQTLKELRVCLMDAELSISGGVSPRLSPMVTLAAAAGLMQRAGFSLPVIDEEIVTLTYQDAFSLMHDLRGMAENNAHIQRLRHPTRREIFVNMALLYQRRFAGATGQIPATFEILFLHGWK